MKRRLLLGVMLALLLVLGIAAIMKHWQSTWENHRITKENFEQIVDGMTQAEVEEILGHPTAVVTISKDFGRMLTWEYTRTQDHLMYVRTINIYFDPSNRKWGSGAYSDRLADVDVWLRLKLRAADWSPWLAKHIERSCPSQEFVQQHSQRVDVAAGLPSKNWRRLLKV